MTGQHENMSFVNEAAQSLVRFFLKILVTNFHPFVDKQDIRLHGGGDGEGEAQSHSLGISVDGHFQEMAKTGEFLNVRQGFFHFTLGHSP